MLSNKGQYHDVLRTCNWSPILRLSSTSLPDQHAKKISLPCLKLRASNKPVTRPARKKADQDLDIATVPTERDECQRPTVTFQKSGLKGRRPP